MSPTNNKANFDKGAKNRVVYKYQLYTYDIVKVNKIYEVNDVRGTDSFIEIPASLNDEEIIKVLLSKIDYAAYYIQNIGDIRIDGEDEYTLYFVDEEKELPLFELRCVNNRHSFINEGTQCTYKL